MGEMVWLEKSWMKFVSCRQNHYICLVPQETFGTCRKDILSKSVLRYYSCHRKSPVFKTVQVMIQQNALVFCLYPLSCKGKGLVYAKRRGTVVYLYGGCLAIPL